MDGFPSLRQSACLECGMPLNQSVSYSLLVGACAKSEKGGVVSSYPFVAPYSPCYSISLPEGLAKAENWSRMRLHLFQPAWLIRLGMQDLKR